MMEPDPEKRPTCAEVLAAPFIKKVAVLFSHSTSSYRWFPQFCLVLRIYPNSWKKTKNRVPRMRLLSAFCSSYVCHSFQQPGVESVYLNQTCQFSSNRECGLPVSPTRWRDRYRLPVTYNQATSHLTAMAAKDFSNLTYLKLQYIYVFYILASSIEIPCKMNTSVTSQCPSIYADM